MSIEILAEIDREVILILDGKSHNVTGQVGSIIKCKRRSDGFEFIKLQADFGIYCWNAPLEDWNKDISIDPEAESRWMGETEFLTSN